MVESFECRECGETFTRERARGRKPHWCSDHCRWKSQHRARYVPVEPSPERRAKAGRLGGSARMASMSAAQRAELAAKAAAQRWAGHETAPKRHKELRACPFCSAVVPMSANQRTCGADECRLARNAERMREGGWMKARRAQQTTAEIEQFTPQEIFERDGWMCGICSKPVDPELRWPNKMSASIDHKVPLSHGGPHVRENVRCSHLTCNTARGNRTRTAARVS